MAQRLAGGPDDSFRTTDHSDEIIGLINLAQDTLDADLQTSLRLAAELLASHDDTGISLDDWPTARRFVENLVGHPVLPNLV